MGGTIHHADGGDTMFEFSDEVTRKVITVGATAMVLFAATYLATVADLARRAGPAPWAPEFRELAKVPFAFEVLRRW